MNSLSDLNYEAQKPLSFTDTRTQTITFTPNVAVNQSLTVLQNGQFYAPVGTNLTTAINPESKYITYQPNVNVLTSGFTYAINLGWMTGDYGIHYAQGNVYWGETTEVNSSDYAAYKLVNPLTTGNIYVYPGSGYGVGPENTTGSPNQYTAYGIKGVADWNQVKNPLVRLPIENENRTSLTYQSTISTSTESRSWYTYVTVLGLDELTDASADFTVATGDNTVLYHPNIAQISNVSLQTTSYTCNVSYSHSNAISSLSSSGTGGTSSFNSATNTLSITGNATQIGSHLNALHVTPASGFTGRWVMTYDLYNPTSGFTSRERQYFKKSPNAYATTPSPTFWDDNTVNTYSGPEIINSSVAEVWIYSNDFNANITGSGHSVTHSTSIATMYSDFGNNGGPVTAYSGYYSWGGDRMLILKGSTEQLNRMLSALKFIPTADAGSSNWHMTYEYRDSGLALLGSDVQLMMYKNTIGEVSNIDAARYFIPNTPDQAVFSTNTPQIIETVAGNLTYPTYVVNISTSAGKFGFTSSGASNAFSYSGTKTAVNSTMANVLFYPNTGVSGTQAYTMQIIRAGNVILNQSMSLVSTT